MTLWYIIDIRDRSDRIVRKEWAKDKKELSLFAHEYAIDSLLYETYKASGLPLYISG